MILVSQGSEGVHITLRNNLIFQHVFDLQKQFQQLLETTAEGIAFVLDLSQVAIIDSMGLKLIVGLLKSCQSQNRELILKNVSPAILQVMRLCGLHENFKFEAAVSTIG